MDEGKCVKCGKDCTADYVEHGSMWVHAQWDPKEDTVTMGSICYECRTKTDKDPPTNRDGSDTLIP